MLAADAQAAAWITWLTALAADTRLRPQDAATLTAYLTKLGSTNTTEGEDHEVLRIHYDFIDNRANRSAVV